jgi:hypothetical protein
MKQQLDIRVAIPGLPITTPNPFAIGLGGSETAGLQLAAALGRKRRVTVFRGIERPGAMAGCDPGADWRLH